MTTNTNNASAIYEDKNSVTDATGDFSQIYLTFMLDGQHYGIPIGNVIEILKIQPSTELPELPYYSKGIINLRGQVIPLIDVNLRFGKTEKEYTDRTCIIIVEVDESHTGLIVDAVEEVIPIDKSLTSAPPNFRSDNSAKYITSIAKLEKHAILLLDVRRLASNLSTNITVAI